jgi:hypothetical protein
MYRDPVPRPGGASRLQFLDDDGTAVSFEDGDGQTFLDVIGHLDAATVSACPDCSARVLASVALVDLLDQAAPHPRVGELLDLADDAPTLHIFVVDRASRCRHKRWRDPLADEWRDVVPPQGPHVRR